MFNESIHYAIGDELKSFGLHNSKQNMDLAWVVCHVINAGYLKVKRTELVHHWLNDRLEAFVQQLSRTHQLIIIQ